MEGYYRHLDVDHNKGKVLNDKKEKIFRNHDLSCKKRKKIRAKNGLIDWPT